MSDTANWSYKNTAMIRPRLSLDMVTGDVVYGDEYEIACNWMAESAQQRTNEGAEFVSRHVIFTEDSRPQYLDMILLNGATVWEEIRSTTEWDMAMFDELNDYKLVT